MEHTFTTDGPTKLYVELGKGSLAVHAGDVTTTTVTLDGAGADETVVTQDGDVVSIIAPERRTGFRSRHDLEVHAVVELPTGSQLRARTGSADVTTTGSMAMVSGTTGSGDVAVEAVERALDLSTGSGDVHVARLVGDGQLKSGSGDVRVDAVAGALSVSTGSGDVALGTTDGPVTVKTGSGDLVVQASREDLRFSSGSGDLRVVDARRGRLQVKSASGNVAVAVPEGTPVWTDIRTVGGEVRSTLEGVGEPRDGQDHVELRVNTVSGDVALQHA
jgi:DUF4097 and DUF4098 domain-containing protein YvlB